MIEVKGLTKTFDGFKALDDVNIHVKKNSVYGLMGPNGAGKTTLLLNIVDALVPNSGEVLINGASVRDNPEAKKNVVFIPDEVFYFTNSTPLSLMRYYKGIYQQFDSDLFNKLRDLFTEISLKMPVRKMSKGMKKQVAFWLSICCKPEILILDEPVDGLDPVMRHNIWQLLLNRIALDGMTVLISSHNLRELEDVCDHIGIMNHGKIVLEESLEELKKNIFKI
ncbi:MAG: ABC transporter ATP-binding protein, partial [Clostridia bacterium]|nr:ABC transporter ATP-binding protein [Clostridia bacterium]